jgi:ATP-dependent protease ClpP protease subunit
MTFLDDCPKKWSPWSFPGQALVMILTSFWNPLKTPRPFKCMVKIFILTSIILSAPETIRAAVWALMTAKEGEVATIAVNSFGGQFETAQAVYVALLETKAKTRAKIVNAAGAASIVVMACDEILPTPFCTMMIHNASAGATGKVGDMAAASSHYRDHFQAWFTQLYDGFLTGDEVTDVAKGQEFYLKENDIKIRLKNWISIRERRKL